MERNRELNLDLEPRPFPTAQRGDPAHAGSSASEARHAMNAGLTETAPGRYMISPLAAPSEAERAWIKDRHESVLDALQPEERSAMRISCTDLPWLLAASQP